jgi:hypothetical protein
MIEVGRAFPFIKDRLFLRLIVSPPVAPVGTVITTGDQPLIVLNGLQVAVELDTGEPQV